MIFTRKCRHQWSVYKASNALQQDDMGYPLRLFIMKCDKCGASEHAWIDVAVEELDELKTGESVLVKWR
jgi:hypothetical protein